MFGPLLSPAPGQRHSHGLKLHRDAYFGEVSILPTQPARRRNPAVTGFGTPCAIRYLTLGVAADSTPRPTGKGGARNRADRVSHSLSKAQVANLIAATGHATQIGLPLNRMITIHWQAAGVPLEVMARATGRFVDLLSKAIARQGHRTAWLWVHENGDGKGAHCHLLAHAPRSAGASVRKLQRGWLRRITGSPYKDKVIKSRPIGGRIGVEASLPDLHTANLQTALHYCLKGADPSACSAFQLHLREPGGRIIGKRCGTSQNIAAKARGGGTR